MIGAVVVAELSFVGRNPAREDNRMRLAEGEDGGGTNSLAVSPDGSLIATTDTEGRVAVRDEEKATLQADLGSARYLMLRNHGLLTVGETVADAFFAMYIFETTCQIQIAAQASDGALRKVRPEVIDGVADALKIQSGGLSQGVFVWPSLIRKLDRIDEGYRQ